LQKTPPIRFCYIRLQEKKKTGEKKESFTNTDGCRILAKKKGKRKAPSRKKKPRSSTKQEKKLQPKDNPGIYFFCTLFSVKNFPFSQKTANYRLIVCYWRI
jgi:hypothetical protein